MKTKAELKEIIQSWWEYNQTLAQVPEGRYFTEQIVDWESGFRMYTREGWVSTNPEIEVVRASDLKEGLGIHLKSGETDLEGILNTKTGEWKDKGASDTTTYQIRGASING